MTPAIFMAHRNTEIRGLSGGRCGGNATCALADSTDHLMRDTPARRVQQGDELSFSWGSVLPPDNLDLDVHTYPENKRVDRLERAHKRLTVTWNPGEYVLMTDSTWGAVSFADLFRIRVEPAREADQ